MRITATKDNANWVIDDIISDFKANTKHTMVDLNDNPDIIWFGSFWGFKNDYGNMVKVCPFALKLFQIHHIETTKLNEYPFKELNRADGCIVCNKKTKEEVEKHLSIPVTQLPYWVIAKRTAPSLCDKVARLRDGFKDSSDQLLIGSFQKDSVYNTNRPKLCKGPDIFLQVIKKLNEIRKIKVVLGGYSRKYLIDNFEKLNIPYVYLERYKDINSLYDCLDWYLVTSRIEGGPQAVLESAYRKVKVLSTDVGVASEILHPDCICGGVEEFVGKMIDNVDKTEDNYRNVCENYIVEKAIPVWDAFFGRSK